MSQLTTVVCLLLSRHVGRNVQGATTTPPKRCDETQKIVLTRFQRLKRGGQPVEDTGHGAERLDSPFGEVTRWERLSCLDVHREGRQ